MITCTQLSKVFNGNTVIAGLDIEFADQKTTVLLGASGSGKSTLIRLIIGLIPPDTGMVCVDGKDISDFARLEISKQFGYVIQNAGLFPHLNAAENVLLPTRVHGWSQEHKQKKIHELCELVDIDPGLLSQYPCELSGGQQQRVGLMRALVLDPPYLLMDEPLSALDPIIRASLQQQLRKIFRQLNKTVIFVTHDLHEAGFLADRIVLLNEGKIEQQGLLREFKKEPATEFVSLFVSSQSYPEEGRV